MASGPLFKTLQEEATCSICLELMTKPVSICCGHSFCQSCIMEDLESQQHVVRWTFHCPVCRSQFQEKDIRPVKELENIINSIKTVEPELLCEEHGKPLQLFCEDEEQLICLRCERTEHKGHATALVEDVCESYKNKFQEAVTKLKSLENQCNSLKLDVSEQKIKFEEKIEQRRKEIMSDFEKFHVILHEDKQTYLRQLDTFKEETLKKLGYNESSLETQGQKLKNHILRLENKCQGSAQNLLQDAVKDLHRSSSVKLESPKTVSLELPSSCQGSKFYLAMKKFLKAYHVSVTLDPDTAHHELIVTENQHRVTRGCSKKKNRTIKRFTVLPCVLGWETFTSGRHYFEVNVQESVDWDVGVCLENVSRDDNKERAPESGFWAIGRCRVKGLRACTQPVTVLNSERVDWHVGVFVNCNNGSVTFYNCNDNSHIFTFQNLPVSVPLKPYFRVGKGSILCPAPLDK